MTDKPRHKAIFIINPISGVKRKGLDEFRSLLDEHLDKSVFDANILLILYLFAHFKIIYGKIFKVSTCRMITTQRMQK